LFARYFDESGEPVLGGIEPLWGFSCPLLLPRPVEHARELAVELGRLDNWNRMVITGLDPESDLYLESIRAFASLGRVYRADGIERCVADLGDGIQSWLARRSPRFRQQWRRRERDAEAEGITVEVVTEPDGLMDRFLAIEGTSWKGAEGDGITSSGMEATYRAMIDSLEKQGRLRAGIARRDGADVGFILGGVRAGIYRGLQLSYSQSVEHLGVGHLLQAHELKRVGPEIHTYDLGMDMEYKRRWSDEIRSTVVVIVHRSGRTRTST
jgi:hypothetical protein